MSGHTQQSLVDQASGVWLAHKTHPNLTLVIPGLSSHADLQKLKKTLYYNQIKRTGNFKFYLSLTNPSLVDGLLSCINDGLDGVVIESDILITAWLGHPPTSEESTLIISYLSQIVDLCYERTIDCWITGSLVVFNPEYVQKLIKAHVTGFITVASHLPFLTGDIARNEVNISKNKHREKKKSKL